MEKCSKKVIASTIDGIDYYRYCYMDSNHLGMHQANLWERDNKILYWTDDILILNPPLTYEELHAARTN